MSAINRAVLDSQTLTVAESGTTSEWFACGPWIFGSYQMPAAITGTEVTVEFSNDKTNPTTVPEASSLETNPATVAANGTYLLPAMTFAAKYFRLKFTTTQAAARTIRLFMKG